MYEIRLHVCERMINMVGGTFGITGQKQYRNDLGQVPGYDKFAEDKKGKQRGNVFLYVLCIFCCLRWCDVLYWHWKYCLYHFFFWEVVSRKQKLPGIHQEDLAGRTSRTIAHAGRYGRKGLPEFQRGISVHVWTGSSSFWIGSFQDIRWSMGLRGHNWNDPMGQWDGNGKKVLTEKGIQTK